MPMKSRPYWLLTGAVFLMLLVYLFPVAIQSDIAHTSANIFNGQLTALGRSIIFAVSSAMLCCIIGFWCALKLRHFELESKRGQWLSILILPFLLGNVSVAYIFKILLLQNSLKVMAFENSWMIFGILLVIQVWQYGSLFAYLLWLSLKNMPAERLDFAMTNNLTRYEEFRDLYLPHSKNLLLLLFLIGLVFSFYEDIKLTLIFAVSPGTDSELIGHWLYREFRSDLLINFNYAAKTVASDSFLIVLPAAIITFLLFSFLVYQLITLITRTRADFAVRRSEVVRGKHKLFYMLVLGVLCFPLALMAVFQPIAFQSGVSLLWQPLFLTLIAAAIASVLAVTFSVALRLISPAHMGYFNTRSILMLAVLYVVRLTPPIVLLVAGFKWTGLLDLSQQAHIVVFWMIGHCMLCLPLLSSFLLVIHFRVDKSELDYIRVFKVPERKLLRWNFISRFKGEYALTFLFATTIIWNEGIINRIFSDSIPSFVSILLRTISSRQADYSEAMMFLLVSISLGIFCLIIWSRSLTMAQRETR